MVVKRRWLARDVRVQRRWEGFPFLPCGLDLQAGLPQGFPKVRLLLSRSLTTALAHDTVSSAHNSLYPCPSDTHLPRCHSSSGTAVVKLTSAYILLTFLNSPLFFCSWEHPQGGGGQGCPHLGLLVSIRYLRVL